MRTLSALTIGSAIFAIDGKHVVIAGFRGDVFVGFHAVNVDGFWYQDFTKTIGVLSEKIMDMIRRKDFVLANRATAAPTSDEIDAWFQNPSSLGNRYPIVEFYCRQRYDCTIRDKWISQQRQVGRQICAALRKDAA